MSNRLVFVPEIPVRESFGCPVNANNAYIAREMPSQEFIDRAAKAMQELFSCLENIGVFISNDSEQECVLVVFPDDPFDVTYVADRNGPVKLDVINKSGRLAGMLIDSAPLLRSLREIDDEN